MIAAGGGSPAIVQPLGVFGPTRDAPAVTAIALMPLREGLNPELRARVASYLSAGTVVLAFMEYTTDLLEGRFGVSGDSGVLSDGVYYWRRDAVEYVTEYCIDLPPDALEHMRSQDWAPPVMDDQALMKIDYYLFTELSAR